MAAIPTPAPTPPGAPRAMRYARIAIPIPAWSTTCSPTAWTAPSVTRSWAGCWRGRRPRRHSVITQGTHDAARAPSLRVASRLLLQRPPAHQGPGALAKAAAGLRLPLLQQGDPEVGREELPHLLVRDAEGGATLIAGGPSQADQQPLAARRHQLGQVEGVALPGSRRQGDQGGAIVEGADLRRLLDMEVEEVAAPKLHVALAANLEACLAIARRHPLPLGHELLDRLRRQLDAQHRMGLAGQPAHVQALAAERHQHLGAGPDSEARPVLHQYRVGMVAVKADAPLTPALEPFVGHGASSEPAIALALAARQVGNDQPHQQAGTGHPAAVHEVAHQQVFLLGVQARLQLANGLAGLLGLGVELAVARLEVGDARLAALEGLALHLGAALPLRIDALQLGGELGHLLLQLGQAHLGAGGLLQLAGEYPDGVAVAVLHAAVVAAGFQPGHRLTGGEGTDDAIAVGGTAAHIGGDGVADPVGRVALLGLHRQGQEPQGRAQGESLEIVSCHAVILLKLAGFHSGVTEAGTGLLPAPPR